ncbi:hypothetical protein [Demequina lutea]|uniref:Uncharacterized protein n=1 Tax=Demequina lutea TaxID=431489 RepID=A0A7Z0CK28_9MICO|nr:hypothetical protein [Demequina lutea]NYI41417.1 hypothetical protein [Demequina lutea]
MDAVVAPIGGVLGGDIVSRLLGQMVAGMLPEVRLLMPAFITIAGAGLVFCAWWLVRFWRSGV